MVFLTHAKVRLALHELQSGLGVSLLLLHGLGERSPDVLPDWFDAWRGPIAALDFTGHGASTVPRGGGYSAEILMGDVDAALQHLGEATLFGRGLGAYIALLAAGARPDAVKGAILADGPGLAGGGSRPGSPTIAAVDPTEAGPPDPFALVEMARDLRPPDYATAFARQALHLAALERPITVCARERPEWLQAVIDEPGVEVMTLDEAIAYYTQI